MIYGNQHYGKPKSNWNAVVVNTPKILSKGSCYLYIKSNKESSVKIKKLTTLEDMQKETYYTLDKNKMKYFIKQ